MLLRAIVVLALLVGSVSAQPAVPTLTDVQTLRVQNALLRVQLAASELERAREAANALIHALQQPGFDLDLERLVYVPKKSSAPETGGVAKP